jgi:hypothetical protein
VRLLNEAADDQKQGFMGKSNCRVYDVCVAVVVVVCLRKGWCTRYKFSGTMLATNIAFDWTSFSCSFRSFATSHFTEIQPESTTLHLLDSPVTTQKAGMAGPRSECGSAVGNTIHAKLDRFGARPTEVKLLVRNPTTARKLLTDLRLRTKWDRPLRWDLYAVPNTEICNLLFQFMY